MEPEPSYTSVKLHLYDVSRGLASRFSPVLLGRQVDGLWHTNVVVGETEVSYSPPLRRFPAGSGTLGAPDRVIDLGVTAIPGVVVDDMIIGLSRSKYTPAAYDLLYNNCNHFAHEFATMVTGAGIPDDVLNQTQALLDSPMGEYFVSRWGAAVGGQAQGQDQAPRDSRPATAPSTSTNPPPQAAAGGTDAGAAATPTADFAHFEGLLRDLMSGFLSEQGGQPGAKAAAHNVWELMAEAAQRFMGGAAAAAAEGAAAEGATAADEAAAAAAAAGAGGGGGAAAAPEPEGFGGLGWGGRGGGGWWGRGRGGWGGRGGGGCGWRRGCGAGVGAAGAQAAEPASAAGAASGGPAGCGFRAGGPAGCGFRAGGNGCSRGPWACPWGAAGQAPAGGGCGFNAFPGWGGAGGLGFGGLPMPFMMGAGGPTVIVIIPQAPAGPSPFWGGPGPYSCGRAGGGCGCRCGCPGASGAVPAAAATSPAEAAPHAAAPPPPTSSAPAATASAAAGGAADGAPAPAAADKEQSVGGDAPAAAPAPAEEQPAGRSGAAASPAQGASDGDAPMAEWTDVAGNA